MANIPINHYKTFITDYNAFMSEANQYLIDYQRSLVSFDCDKDKLRDKSIELKNTVNMLINSLDGRSDKFEKYEEFRNDLNDMKGKIEELY